MKMKQLIILSTILFAFFSCSIKKKPEFLSVKNIKVLESNSKHITFTANALFKNPNLIGGKLITDEIKIFVNDKEMGTISTENFKVPAKKEFSIPLKANILTKKLLNSSTLSNLIGSIFKNKTKVQYIGDIKYKILFFSNIYHVDETETLKIKL